MEGLDADAPAQAAGPVLVEQRDAPPADAQQVANGGLSSGGTVPGDVIGPRRFQRVLLGGDELSAQGIMRRRGGIKLKAKLSNELIEKLKALMAKFNTTSLSESMKDGKAQLICSDAETITQLQQDFKPGSTITFSYYIKK